MASSPSARSSPPWPAVLQAELVGATDEAAELRRRCSSHLPWLSDRVIDDVLLVLSELVSNVHRHTPHRCGSVTVSADGGVVHIRVRDRSSVPPTLVEDAPVGGRGIRIVDALARQWGVVREPDGKTVWAEIAT